LSDQQDMTLLVARRSNIWGDAMLKKPSCSKGSWS